MQTATTRHAEQPPARLWRAPILGTCHTIEVSHGTVEYFERGDGPPLVFAHGWLANANLWRHVVDALAVRYRCIVLDLPLGSHRRAVAADADLTPAGCGALIGDVLEALQLRGVTLVGNDSGGAYSQIAAAGRPEPIARIVLSSCETLYDTFPPEPFTSLPVVAASGAETLRALLVGLEDRALRRTPAAYGLLVKHALDDVVSDSYALPSLRDADVLRDVTKVMASADTAAVHAAARRLIATYRRPVLFAWPPDDQLFPIVHAERYAAELTDGRVVRIEDAYSFTPEDQPARLAGAIDAFVQES